VAEKLVTNLFDNESPEADQIWDNLFEHYGLGRDTFGEPDSPLHDFSGMDCAEAEAYLLQNAYNRHLTVKQTLRLVLEGRILIEATREKGKLKSTS
jgi:hypothetical protein